MTGNLMEFSLNMLLAVLKVSNYVSISEAKQFELKLLLKKYLINLDTVS